MDQRLQEKDIVVFDVGNVLLKFDPKIISEDFGLSPRLEEAVFGTGLWAWIDTGLICNGEVARLMCRSVQSESREDYLRVCAVLDDFIGCLTPMAPVRWLPELKAAGKKLYYLTNFSSPAFEKTLERFPFFKAFDGGVVSAHERIVKPMPAIYRLLCRRYGFSPKDALFIDDNPENTKAAQQEGFAVWTLRGEDILSDPPADADRTEGMNAT